MRKKTAQFGLIIVAALALTLSGCAVLESEMSYQGQLTDDTGSPVGDGNYQMTFRLYDEVDDPIGSALWVENQTVAVSGGLFNVTLGEVTAIDTDIFAQKLWLGVEVEGDGEMTPRQELTGAPFAMSLAPGAAMQGTINLTDDLPGMLNIRNAGSGAGVSINHYGSAGLAISGAFVPGDPGSFTVGDYGLKVEFVQHGAIITATDGIGIMVIGQGTVSGDDDAIRAEAAKDALVAISEGTDTADYGVYGQSQGGRGVYGYSVTGAYAGYFDGVIYVQGCDGCTLRYTARNVSGRALQPGDLVSAAGVETDLEGLRLPVFRTVPATAGQAVLGVVVGRTELFMNEPGVDEGAPGAQFDAVGGEVAPGDYLVVVVQGPVQVRAGSAAEIQAGDLLYFGTNGLTTDAVGPAIGMALDGVDPAGLVWVLVGFH